MGQICLGCLVMCLFVGVLGCIMGLPCVCVGRARCVLVLCWIYKFVLCVINGWSLYLWCATIAPSRLCIDNVVLQLGRNERV